MIEMLDIQMIAALLGIANVAISLIIYIKHSSLEKNLKRFFTKKESNGNKFYGKWVY